MLNCQIFLIARLQIWNVRRRILSSSFLPFFLFIRPRNLDSYRRRRYRLLREERVRGGDGKLGSNNESRGGKRSNGCATDYAHSECSRQLGHGKDKKGGGEGEEARGHRRSLPFGVSLGLYSRYPRSLISLPDKLDYGVSSCPPAATPFPHILPLSPSVHSTRMANDAYETLFSLRKQPFFLFIAPSPSPRVPEILSSIRPVGKVLKSSTFSFPSFFSSLSYVYMYRIGGRFVFISSSSFAGISIVLQISAFSSLPLFERINVYLHCVSVIFPSFCFSLSSLFVTLSRFNRKNFLISFH